MKMILFAIGMYFVGYAPLVENFVDAKKYTENTIYDAGPPIPRVVEQTPPMMTVGSKTEVTQIYIATGPGVWGYPWDEYNIQWDQSDPALGTPSKMTFTFHIGINTIEADERGWTATPTGSDAGECEYLEPWDMWLCPFKCRVFFDFKIVSGDWPAPAAAYVEAEEIAPPILQDETWVDVHLGSIGPTVFKRETVDPAVIADFVGTGTITHRVLPYSLWQLTVSHEGVCVVDGLERKIELRLTYEYDDKPADVNRDGVVDVADFVQVLLSPWGECEADTPEDVDTDCNVDVDDMIAVLMAM